MKLTALDRLELEIELCLLTCDMVNGNPNQFNAPGTGRFTKGKKPKHDKENGRRAKRSKLYIQIKQKAKSLIPHNKLAFKTEKNYNDIELIEELVTQGKKITIEDVLFATKDATGQIIWLEKGNYKAGLEHILNGNPYKTDYISKGHLKEFHNSYRVNEENIPALIRKIVTDGKVIHDKKVVRDGKAGYDRVYACEEYRLMMVGVGTNGFIVTAFPVRGVMKWKE